jgi:hypothetical protein
MTSVRMPPSSRAAMAGTATPCLPSFAASTVMAPRGNPASVNGEGCPTEAGERRRQWRGRRIRRIPLDRALLFARPRESPWVAQGTRAPAPTHNTRALGRPRCVAVHDQQSRRAARERTCSSLIAANRPFLAPHAGCETQIRARRQRQCAAQHDQHFAHVEIRCRRHEHCRWPDR